ncbi:unnamed protein product [Prorocentrum cordatum]|uniref:CSD domain-containing protein n=1 Tax=Prorocentrum cordatum TaxID=2364126 RepID=A0ABN9WUR9_9DINO|nr:unnamed protein product [Polarella glacialis]
MGHSGSALVSLRRGSLRRVEANWLSEARSKSHRPRKRSRTPERVPPTSFADYEPAPDGSGWYVYKKTGKWKYHPETGLYLHIKSSVYYIQKDGDPKAFRKIEDDDDPTIRKMKQSEEMRKAIQSTEFVAFGESGQGAPEGAGGSSPRGAAPQEAAAPAPAAKAEAGPARPPEPAVQQQQAKEEVPKGEEKIEGKVREWNSEKGFGFIVPLIKEGQEPEAVKSVFVHLWNVVGSTHTNPVNLREGARVQYKLGEQDGRPRAMDVVMLGKDRLARSPRCFAKVPRPRPAGASGRVED